jgi:hypothetical protein
MAFNFRQPCLPSRVLAGLLLALLAVHAGASPIRDPKLKSSSVLVIDQKDSSVLYSRHADVAMPIASITKLMTALVVLDAKQPLNEPIQLTNADRNLQKSDFSRLAVGTTLTRGDLDAPGADVLREPRRARAGEQLPGRHARHGRRHECQSRRARHDQFAISSIPPACRAKTSRVPRTWPSW